MSNLPKKNKENLKFILTALESIQDINNFINTGYVGLAALQFHALQRDICTAKSTLKNKNTVNQILEKINDLHIKTLQQKLKTEIEELEEDGLIFCKGENNE